MKPVLIFRHIDAEGPGSFSEVLDHRNLPYQILAVDEGEPIPDDPNHYSGLVFMGGPMSVNDSLPWIQQECSLIQKAADLQIPVLGHCLGGQLISKALGGTVGPNTVKEIGWHEVSPIRNEVTSPWVKELPDQFTVFHWHGETFSLPKGAEVLLSNQYCTNQGFVLGNILALQCHVEMQAEMVRQWAKLYEHELQTPTESVQDSATITQNVEVKCDKLWQWAEPLYERWLLGLRYKENSN